MDRQLRLFGAVVSDTASLDTSGPRPGDPLPDEIARRAAAIRAAWGPKDFARSSPPPKAWQVPTIAAGDVASAVDRD